MNATELKAAQDAYWARPYAVQWRDSHFSITEKFLTLEGAYEYIEQMWTMIRNKVSERRFCGSQLWHSYLETPEGRVQLSYVLMCEDVDSYGYSRRVDPRDLPPPTNRVAPKADDQGIAVALGIAPWATAVAQVGVAATRSLQKMKPSEVTRRLETLSEQQITTGISMVRGGYGAHGITLEHTVTMKQANALFELVRAIDEGKCPHVYLPWTEAAKRCPACGAIQHNRS